MPDISGYGFEKLDDYRWKIPQSFKKGMRVPGIIYASEKLLADICRDKALEQVINVAFLPGIVKASMAMPDIHWGYGFPIGGVAATDIEAGGVVSPGGVGFDINCGVRLLRTDLHKEDVAGCVKELAHALFSDIPSGIGSKGDIVVSQREEKELLVKGVAWAVSKGYATSDDRECTEEQGCIQGADPDCVSQRAYQRGKAQSGTLGSGNHFLEVQCIDKVYDKAVCEYLGLGEGQITVMIHTGSRGLGYQICDDYTREMVKCLQKYSISLPDRQLSCAPVDSPEGQSYLAAMKAAANYAWVNRQCLTYLTRKTFERIFCKSWESLGMTLIYDVAHNIAKIEKHKVAGKEKKLCVHRKGATRAFGPGHPDLPEKYRLIGQPVIIPGDMGRNSYLLTGTEKAMEETFGSTCHGAGRVKSRSEATRNFNANRILAELEKQGIIVMAAGRNTVVEEAPMAYKDINDVVEAVTMAGISRKVCRMKPLAVVKG